jgi:hypothetical protein
MMMPESLSDISCKTEEMQFIGWNFSGHSPVMAKQSFQTR